LKLDKSTLNFEGIYWQGLKASIGKDCGVMPIFEFVMFAAFVLSSGLFFNKRFRENFLAVGLAGMIAVLSSYFLFETLWDRFPAPTPRTTRNTQSPPAAPTQGMPSRVRGAIEKVDGNTLTVKSRDGATVNVVLKDGATVTGVAKAAPADVKQNSFVGITAMPQPDGTQKAIEIHIFPEALRGRGEGHRSWDLVPNSTMTNAYVEQLVAAVDGPMLTMKYMDGEKKISVPNNVTIVRLVAGDRSDLKPGAKIFVVAGTKVPNGDIETTGIIVGKDGVTPPM
jgi:hypothetical protein